MSPFFSFSFYVVQINPLRREFFITMVSSIPNLVLIGVAIHLTMFFLIIAKATFSKKFRTEVIQLPLYIIILIGLFWPLMIIFVLIFLLGWYPGLKKL